MHVVAMESLSENLVPGAKVLDVGSGSGYLTACFGKLVGPNGRVVGIERLPSLVKWGTSNIKKANPELLESGTVKLVQGDGWQGYPEEAPYDAIHVGAASECKEGTLQPTYINSTTRKISRSIEERWENDYSRWKEVAIFASSRQGKVLQLLVLRKLRMVRAKLLQPDYLKFAMCH